MKKLFLLLFLLLNALDTLQALTVTANFGSASTIPVTAAGYTAIGHDVSLSLGFAPPTGATLMVVKNTGLDFIIGQFSNLPQGQSVNLTYNGVTYPFVANYYGGSGNDLVLQWACQDAYAWGLNYNGQLGNYSTTVSSSVPVLVDQSGALTGKTVVSVAAGGSHSLALCSDGTLAAWGENTYGQLGNNSTTDSIVPVLVDQSALAGKTVVSVEAGFSHSLVLCSDGTLAVWGRNNYGQFGDGTTSDRKVPFLVPASGALVGKKVISVVCGQYFSLALCSDGTLAAWGNNSSGQLGNGSTTNSSVPVLVSRSVPVLAGKTVVSVAAGYSHSLALCSDGTLAAWGNNGSGQLGNGSTTNSSVPVLVNRSGVLAGKTVLSVAAGYSHSLALCSDGTLAQWGGGYGYVPVLVNKSGVLAGKTVVSVAAGGNHSHALCSDGTLVSWGRNDYGELGNGDTAGTGSSVPVLVNQSGALAGKTVVSVPGGDVHSLALCSDGTLASWGSNSSGQLGNITTSSTVPVLVTNMGVLAGKTVVSVAAGGNHSLALCSDGTLAAWGRNNFGQLGNNSKTDSRVPVLVTQSGVLAGKTIVSVAAGWSHSLVLCSDGTLAAWGENTYGRLGNNSTTDSSVPVLVDQSALAGKTVVSVVAGWSHSLALCSDGTWAAWGGYIYGDGSSDTMSVRKVPFLVPASGALVGKKVVSVVCGQYFSLALCSDGTLAAWGNNGSGKLGNGTTTNSSVPVLVNRSGVLAGKTVLSVAAGYSHSLVLCSDGTLAAWGENTDGRLGNNSTTNSSVPVLVNRSGVLAGKTVVSVAGGGNHSIALCSDGTLVAWGVNVMGELGNGGGTTNSSVPVLVTQSGVLAGKTASSVSGGADHSLILAAAPLSNVATLSSLALSMGPLSPTFATATTTYIARVANSVTSTTVTPILTDPMASVRVNGSLVASGGASPMLSLAVGTNTISVLVTAQDGVTTRTYTIKITRAQSSVATLSGLVVKTATLGPKFKSTVISYAARVPKSTISVKVKPTASHAKATIKVNGKAVKSGSMSAAIPLEIGKNTIKVVVTAEDGTAKTYKIVITRTSTMGAAPKSAFVNNKSLVGNAQVDTRTSKVTLDGQRYQQLTVTKPDPAARYVVEVSPDLVHWFSGERHTTIVKDDARVLRVRDNTPVEPRVKRFIRVRP